MLRDWANWDPAAGGFVELPNARLRMLGTVCVGPRGFHALLTDVQRLFQPKPLWDSSLFNFSVIPAWKSLLPTGRLFLFFALLGDHGCYGAEGTGWRESFLLVYFFFPLN